MKELALKSISICRFLKIGAYLFNKDVTYLHSKAPAWKDQIWLSTVPVFEGFQLYVSECIYLAIALLHSYVVRDAQLVMSTNRENDA